MNKTIPVLLALTMTGCAGVNRHNPQNYAGLTYAELTFSPPTQESRRPTLSGAKIWNGKELANGHFEMRMDGDTMTVIWDVGDAFAVDSQAIRAETEALIHKQTTEAVEKIVPAAVESAVKGAVKAIIPLP